MKIIADANIPFVEQCFSSIGEVEVVPGRQITRGVVADADVIVVRSITPVNASLLEGTAVKFVGTATIGFDHIDRDFLAAGNIGFSSAPGSNANSAAEYVIAGLLDTAQKYDIDLDEKSIGIIGVGNVGSRVEKKAAALGMQVVLNDPPLERETHDSKYRPLEELFDCDFITIHTPLTFEGVDKTYHLADIGFFESLKERCVFINASRGAVVETDALKNAILSGRLRGVVLDVWENEPDIDLSLLKMVDIGTPHIAGYSLDGKIAGMIMIYKAVCEHFEIEPVFATRDFLPAPPIHELRVNIRQDRAVDILAGAVQKIYDIRRDDTRLRWIWEKPESKRADYFDNLRKNYPVRRELHNTTVLLGTGDLELERKLAGIGFNVQRFS
jgi:erythronate-4-phosphate dehydrogenase